MWLLGITSILKVTHYSFANKHKTELFQLDYSRKIKFLEERPIVAEAVSKAFYAIK